MEDLLPWNMLTANGGCNSAVIVREREYRGRGWR